MSPRATGGSFVVLGVALAALVFAPWYRIDADGPRRVRSGVSVAGELWTLPILGALIVVCGLVVVVRQPFPGDRGGDWTVGVAAAAAFLGLVWTFLSIFNVRAVAVPLAVADGPRAPLRVESPAFITAAAAACALALALAWFRVGHDDGP